MGCLSCCACCWTRGAEGWGAKTAGAGCGAAGRAAGCLPAGARGARGLLGGRKNFDSWAPVGGASIWSGRGTVRSWAVLVNWGPSCWEAGGLSAKMDPPWRGSSGAGGLGLPGPLWELAKGEKFSPAGCWKDPEGKKFCEAGGKVEEEENGKELEGGWLNANC